MINQDKIDKMNNNINKKSNDGLSSQSQEANITINPSEKKLTASDNDDSKKDSNVSKMVDKIRDKRNFSFNSTDKF